jgi:hypothetical protein
MLSEKRKGDKWILYILVSAGIKFRNKKKVPVPAYTGPFRARVTSDQYLQTLPP